MKAILVLTSANPFYEEELKSLCEACHIEVIDVVIQKLEKINPATYIGKGKIEEIKLKLQDEILALHEEFGTTTIMVSHDPSEMYKLASRVLVLKDGKIIDDGLPKDILLKTQGSQKFSFEGELLDIIKVDVINIAIVAIGQQIVEVVISNIEAQNLIIGEKVNVSTKAFTPIIKTL